MDKQVYKIELPKKWKIHDVFHVLLLKQDTTKKRQVKTIIERDESNGKEYKVKAICDSKVYAKELNSDYLPGFYYLILWKGYPKEKNT